MARAAEEQREQEEQLRRREQELAEREIDIVERELNIIIHQVYQEKPSVKKRKGHFKKSRLLKLGRDSNCISLPSGGYWGGTAGLLFKPMSQVPPNWQSSQFGAPISRNRAFCLLLEI